MKALRFSRTLLALGLVCGAALAQGTNTQPAATAPAGSPVVHRHHRHRQQGVQVIARESRGPSAPAPDETPAQKAADLRLLQQQEAQSADAAAVQNRVVRQAEKQQQQVQQEVRIQDAPGPAQTGVVPEAGAPVQPVNYDNRIQDAPGPEQTIPTPAALPTNSQTPTQSGAPQS